MKIGIISKPEIFEKEFNLEIPGVEFICCSEYGDGGIDVDYYSEFKLKDESGRFVDWDSQRIFIECENWLEVNCKEHHLYLEDIAEYVERKRKFEKLL